MLGFWVYKAGGGVIWEWWRGGQEEVLATLGDWLADPSVKHNATVLLVAGVVYTNEGNYVEALKALHGADTLEK